MALNCSSEELMKQVFDLLSRHFGEDVEFVLHDLTLDYEHTIVDIRHGLKDKDRELQEWLSDLGVPVLCVFTKADKIAKTKRRSTINGYFDTKIYSWGLPLAVSVDEPETIESLRGQIESYLDEALSEDES